MGAISLTSPDALLIVGNLKVGKSTIFSWFTGKHRRRVIHSNNGVQLSSGPLGIGPFGRIVDAPGFHSLHDRSEDAFVIRDLLARRQVGGVLLVLDAKNPTRGLLLACQIARFSFRVAVALNLSDEARQRGVEVDGARLSELLGVPVVETMASEGRGLDQLKKALADARPLKIQNEIEKNLDHLAEGSREIALLESARTQAERLASQVVRERPAARAGWSHRLSALSRRLSTGIPIAFFVLALTYLFVGWFGAGVLVDLLEGKLFGGLVLPVLDGWVSHIPWPWMREMLTGQFGLLTVGLTLSLAIVLPVLATFFFAFALMEDSGYLPRLSLLTDRVLRKIGLNGKGVLPLVMGLSCVTMAVMTTRVLDSRKQRVIATLLLILAMPCAPLLSVMMVLLARLSAGATVVFFGLLILQFFLAGVLANLLIPGKRPDLVLELPPLRAPRLMNVLAKTGQQIRWFLKEAIPYFLLGALVLFCLDQLGVLQVLRDGLQPVSSRLLGLPAESADVFFLTIIRREAGAALLAQQYAAGMYDGVQVMVTLLVMTLMIPCINSVLVMYKERGYKIATVTLATVFLYALLMGGLVNQIFSWLGVQF
jgi:ferrous iron transport protein B